LIQFYSEAHTQTTTEVNFSMQSQWDPHRDMFYYKNTHTHTHTHKNTHIFIYIIKTFRGFLSELWN
jgi:hypothetical protein